jgi:hypothetical protein
MAQFERQKPATAEQMKFQNISKVIAVNFVVIAILLVLLEFALEAYHPIGNRQLLEWGWRWRESPYRARLIDTGLRGPKFYRDEEENQLGFRGRTIRYDDDTKVVLLVGDSQVEAASLPFDELPEVLLEQAVKTSTVKKVAVFSVGAAGWSQDQQLLALREYFRKFRADIVLLWHTPGNDFWENTFPDRSTASTKRGAGHLKPAFLLKDYHKADANELEFYQPPESIVRFAILHKFNLGRGVQKALARLGLVDWESLKDAILNDWLQRIPPPHGHVSVDQSTCPAKVLTFSAIMNEFDRSDSRLVTVDMSREAVDESRSHITPFLEVLSARDEYSVRVTRALFQQIKALVESNGATFKAFVPEFSSTPEPDRVEIRCAKFGGRFFRVGSYRSPILQWRDELNVEEVAVEIGNYPRALLLGGRSDPHLNYFGTRLVMEALAKSVRFAD